jgi:RNA polymerase sigma-70 factor (ECF subfamily)
MSAIPDPDLLRRVEQAIEHLPRLQKEIFLAHRGDGKSYAEIAAQTGLSKRRVERHFATALYKIAKQLGGRKLSWWERRF